MSQGPRRTKLTKPLTNYTTVDGQVRKRQVSKSRPCVLILFWHREPCSSCLLPAAGRQELLSAADVPVVCTGSLITGRGLLDVTCHTRVSPLVIGETGRRMRESLTVWDEGGNVRGLPIPVCSLPGHEFPCFAFENGSLERERVRVA